MAGPREQAFVASPIASAGGRVITSPFQFYTSGEDHLRLRVANSKVGVFVQLFGRFVTSRGTLQSFEHTHQPSADRAVSTSTIALEVGAVLNLTVVAIGATPAIGQTFVLVQLVRGLGPAGVVLGTLLQGYVTSTQHLAWPGSPIVSSTEGEPVLRTILGTLPAPATDFAETVPTGARWELVSVCAELTVQGVPPDRRAELYFPSAIGTLGFYVMPFTHPPGNACQYTWAPNLPNVQTAFSSTMNCPILARPLLLAGQSFNSGVFSMAALDSWQAPKYTVREWLEVL